MVSVIGIGFVGSALLRSFEAKGVNPIFGYDKYKDGGIGLLEDCLSNPILFLCLPTPFDDIKNVYDKSPITETVRYLYENNYPGIVVLKSTVEPGTTEEYSKEFPTLSICHNPEFLSAATAFEDFHNQKHIVIGRGSNCSDEQVEAVYDFYHQNYPQADISLCTSGESESMKCFVNTFYALKIQYFNELYLLCQNNQVDYNNVKDMMLKNGWINPMHTTVPGRDGKLSYGGGCFPKDTNALLQHMKTTGTPHAVLEACIKERNNMREEGVDHSSKHLNKVHDSNLVNGFCNNHLKNGYVNGVSNGVNGVMNGNHH